MGKVIKIGQKSKAETENAVKQFFNDPSKLSLEEKDRALEYIENDFLARAGGDKENISPLLSNIYDERHNKASKQREEFMERSKKAEGLYAFIRDDIVIGLIDCIEYNAMCIPNVDPFKKGEYDISITAVDYDKFDDKVDKILSDNYPDEEDKILELLRAYALREAQRVDSKLYQTLIENEEFMKKLNEYINTPRTDNTMKEFTFMRKVSGEVLNLCKSIVDEGRMRLYASVL